MTVASPRSGSASAPVNHDSSTYNAQLYNSRRPGQPSPLIHRHSMAFSSTPASQGLLLSGQLSSPSPSTSSNSGSPHATLTKFSPPYSAAATTRRERASSLGNEHHPGKPKLRLSPVSPFGKKIMSVASASLAKARARGAQKENDAMVYLDGPQIYTCAQCRTHLTSHDDIISKSFHGRHGESVKKLSSISDCDLSCLCFPVYEP